MRISVVTPCFNAEALIAETVRSILNQTAIKSGRAELEYIIVDGQSSDKTVEIAQELCDQLVLDRGISVQLISEPDSGMYDALAKGLELVSGDVCAFLNAGDFYSATAFDTVADLFQHRSVRWLTGFEVTYSMASQIVSCRLPFRFRRKLFESGLYAGKLLPFVQQESTFWDSQLNKFIEISSLRDFKYAGDYYLWYHLAQQTTLHIVGAYLSGFRIHKGQLSEHLDRYRMELRSVTRLPNPTDISIACLDRIGWYLPSKVKKRLNPKGLFLFDHASQTWK